MAVGSLLLLLGVVNWTAGGSTASPRAALLVLLASLGVLAVFVFARAWKWPRMSALLAPDVMAKDDRAPVLYLRSFEADRRGRRLEARLARSLKRLGPVVAVGRPDEKLPATPHVARQYLREADWQEDVLDLMRRAQLVIIQIGSSRGLTWELVQAVRGLHPERLVLCVGLGESPWCVGGRATKRYQAFRDDFERLFPKGLPDDLGNCAFISFAADWTAQPTPAAVRAS